MDTGVIFLKDVLADMIKGEPFSMTFVTYDGKRKRMGDIIEVEKASCTWREDTKKDKVKVAADPIEKPVRTRQPNHWENATRNILINGTQIRKVHIRLITMYNNKTVIW